MNPVTNDGMPQVPGELLRGGRPYGYLPGFMQRSRGFESRLYDVTRRGA